MCQGSIPAQNLNHFQITQNNWKTCEILLPALTIIKDFTCSCQLTSFLVASTRTEWDWKTLYIWNSIHSLTVGVGPSWTVGQWQRHLHSCEFSHVNSTEELRDSKHTAHKEICTIILIQGQTDSIRRKTCHRTDNQSVCLWLLVTVIHNKLLFSGPTSSDSKINVHIGHSQHRLHLIHSIWIRILQKLKTWPSSPVISITTEHVVRRSAETSQEHVNRGFTDKLLNAI